MRTRHIRLKPIDALQVSGSRGADNILDQLNEWLEERGLGGEDADEDIVKEAKRDFWEWWRDRAAEERRQAIANCPDGESADAIQTLESAGLLNLYYVALVRARNVGEYLLYSPSAFRNIKEDESFELNRARGAAVRHAEDLDGLLEDAESEAQDEEEEAGTRLLLLRPIRIAMVHEEYFDSERGYPQSSIFDMHLRSGDTIEVDAYLHDEGQLATLRRRCWVILEVSALLHEKEVTFSYSLIHSFADHGALRVSDVQSSLSRAVCFDTVCRYLLAGLDLSGEPLPDRVAARHFLNRIHSHGLPAGRVGPADEEGRTVPFAERFLGAMRATSAPLGVTPPPERRLVKTFRDAEIYAADYMRHLGFAEATPTPTGSDGGIDVVSATAVAQVKMEGVATGRPVVQALFGVAVVEGKSSLIFSLAGYTAQALEWADRAGVACFEFAINGEIVAVNTVARELQSAG